MKDDAGRQSAPIRACPERPSIDEGGVDLLQQKQGENTCCTFAQAEVQPLIPRAYVRQRSGLHLDLLNPSVAGWTDEDLAIGLSRTYRWGGHSTWPLPLSVAQHSLTVMALYARLAKRPPSPAELLRELLHDSDEALIGGFDPISQLKPFLGAGYAQIVGKLQAAVFARYRLPDWSTEDHKLHKRADHLAAASEAVHVAGWSSEEVLDLLNIGLQPLKADPLAKTYRCKPWAPWPPSVAARRLLDQLQKLKASAGQEESTAHAA